MNTATHRFRLRLSAVGFVANSYLSPFDVQNLTYSIFLICSCPCRANVSALFNLNHSCLVLLSEVAVIYKCFRFSSTLWLTFSLSLLSLQVFPSVPRPSASPFIPDLPASSAAVSQTHKCTLSALGGGVLVMSLSHYYPREMANRG